jgi:hypothetical protein
VEANPFQHLPNGLCTTIERLGRRDDPQPAYRRSDPEVVARTEERIRKRTFWDECDNFFADQCKLGELFTCNTCQKDFTDRGSLTQHTRKWNCVAKAQTVALTDRVLKEVC